MIERVAKAIANEAFAKCDMAVNEFVAITLAKAAIAAMREPTEEIREAMNSCAGNGMIDWEDLHKALIDEVLNPLK